MIHAFLQGLGTLGSPMVMLALALGSVIGVIIGIIPVIGPLITIAILLPFVNGMSPETGLSLLIGIYAASMAGGSMTSILLNIPGDVTNAATVIDGYPLAQKGQAGRAMGAAILSSAMGGILGVFLAMGMIPLALVLVLAFRAPEMFFLVLLGISVIAPIGKDSLVKSLISGFLGIILSFVGFHAITGASRFTFETTFLYDGLNLIPFILGIFALPELIEVAVKGTTISQAPVVANLTQDIMEGFKDVFRHFWLFLRSSLIGYILGVIPGIGTQVAIFVAYGQAKQFSRNPEKFGTGCIEGVIAPESANNASQGGHMLPTLAFGIPAGAIMAVLLGAFLMVGITPGPAMLKDHLDLSFLLLIGLAVGNILSLALCFLLARWTTKIANVHADFLLPIIVAITFIGTYVAREELLDLIVLLLATVLGSAMLKFNYSRPALILGFILGKLAEKYFFLSLSAFGPLFFLSPLCLVLIVLTVILLFSRQLGRVFQRFPRGGPSGHEA